ncbi:hypothetical protein PENTCL1PPCAC_12198, partial [Pristionchus entomophagus]
DYIVSKNSGRYSKSFKTAERICYDAHALFLTIVTDPKKDSPHPSEVHLYDPTTNTWKKCMSQMMSNHIFEYAYISDYKIYFTHGSKESTVSIAETTDIFDIIANKWYTGKDEIEK